MPTASPTPSPKSTRQWVHAYAALLLKRGEEVRQSTIRELIYAEHGVTASPNLVNDEVKTFWAKTGPLMSARLRRPGIPDEVCTRFDQIWDAALAAAAARHADARGHLEAHTHAAQVAADQARAEADAAVEKWQAQTREIEDLRGDKGHLTERLQATERECKTLAAQCQAQTAHAAAQQAAQDLEQQRLHGRVEHLQQQLAERLASAQRALTDLAESHQRELVKTQDFLMRETARVRDEHKAKTDSLSQALTRERQDNDQLRRLRANARDEAAELRGRLDATDRNIEKLEQRNAQLGEQNDRLEQRNAQLSAQLEPLHAALLARLPRGEDA